MEVVASLSQGRTAAGQCGLLTYKSVPVIFEPPCTLTYYDLQDTEFCNSTVEAYILHRCDSASMGRHTCFPTFRGDDK